MGLSSSLHQSVQRINLLALTAIGAAVAATGTTPVTRLGGMTYLAVSAKFVYDSGGTTAKAYVQTSLDGGATWIDVMSFAFATTTATKVSAVVSTTAVAAGATPTDGTLTDNTILSGLLGDRLRVKYVTTGTYGGASTLTVTALVKS